MDTDRTPTATMKSLPKPRAKPQARSKITNGLRMLDGIDGRSAIARRFRDIWHGLEQEFEINSESDQVLVKQAAALAIVSEQLQAQVVRGELVDHRQIINLAGQLRRTLATLRARTALHGPAPASIHEHLASFGHRLNDDYEEDFLEDAERIGD